MLTFIAFESDNIVGMRVTGKLTALEYDTILAKVNQCLETYPKISLYTELTELEDFDEIAIENYFKHLKFRTTNWKRFVKSALVIDKRWIKNVSCVANKFFPNVEMRGFFPNETELAKEWLWHA